VLPIVQIGPIAVQLPGLLILIGVWFGLWVSEHSGTVEKEKLDRINNMVLLALICSVIGARLGYAAAYPKIFTQNPTSFFSLNPGLLDPWSGIAFGLLAALVYGRRKEIPFWETLDFLSPAVVVFLISTSLANLASGNGYGEPTQLPWAINLWGKYRHPTQVYEALVGFLILLAILPERRYKVNLVPGIRFLTFLILYSAARLFLEAFRGDSTMIYAGIRAVQILYWIVLGIGLWTIGAKLKASVNEHQTGSQ
jgi:prolipoprotein diacylglyceryl transferase